jgi:hypothetical protein
MYGLYVLLPLHIQYLWVFRTVANMNNDHIRTFNIWYSPDCCNSLKNISYLNALLSRYWSYQLIQKPFHVSLLEI